MAEMAELAHARGKAFVERSRHCCTGCSAGESRGVWLSRGRTRVGPGSGGIWGAAQAR